MLGEDTASEEKLSLHINRPACVCNLNHPFPLRTPLSLFFRVSSDSFVFPSSGAAVFLKANSLGIRILEDSKQLYCVLGLGYVIKVRYNNILLISISIYVILWQMSKNMCGEKIKDTVSICDCFWTWLRIWAFIVQRTQNVDTWFQNILATDCIEWTESVMWTNAEVLSGFIQY